MNEERQTFFIFIVSLGLFIGTSLVIVLFNFLKGCVK